MGLQEMKQVAEQMKVDYSICTSMCSKQAISKAYHELLNKIKEEERRLSASPTIRIVDGVSIEIPECFQEHNGMRFHVHSDTLYLIERDKLSTKEEYSSSLYATRSGFHWHSYAWVKHSNRYTKLCVRMLGNDGYGDRAFCSAFHYKHPSDSYPYMETAVRLDNYTYRPYIEHILQEVAGWTIKYLKRS